MYRAQIRSNILDNGTGIVFDANFATKTLGADTFTESSANAATVTINGDLAKAGDGRAMLISSSAGTVGTLSKSSGLVQPDFITVKDITATGGATWRAGVNSYGKSVNTGWFFDRAVSAPAVSVTPQALTLAPGVLIGSIGSVAATLSARGLTLAPGVLAVPIAPCGVSVVAMGLTLDPGVLTVGVGTVDASVTPQALTLTPGVLIGSIGSVAATLTGRGLTLTPGVLVVPVGVCGLSVVAMGLTLDPGVLTVGVGTVDVISSALGLGYVPGGLTHEIIAVTMSPSVRPLTLDPGVLTVGVGTVLLTLWPIPIRARRGGDQPDIPDEIVEYPASLAEFIKAVQSWAEDRGMVVNAPTSEWELMRTAWDMQEASE